MEAETNGSNGGLLRKAAVGGAIPLTGAVGWIIQIIFAMQADVASLKTDMANQKVQHEREMKESNESVTRLWRSLASQKDGVAKIGVKADVAKIIAVKGLTCSHTKPQMDSNNLLGLPNFNLPNEIVLPKEILDKIEKLEQKTDPEDYKNSMKQQKR